MLKEATKEPEEFAYDSHAASVEFPLRWRNSTVTCLFVGLVAAASLAASYVTGTPLVPYDSFAYAFLYVLVELRVLHHSFIDHPEAATTFATLWLVFVCLGAFFAVAVPACVALVAHGTGWYTLRTNAYPRTAFGRAVAATELGRALPWWLRPFKTIQRPAVSYVVAHSLDVPMSSGRTPAVPSESDRASMQAWVLRYLLRCYETGHNVVITAGWQCTLAPETWTTQVLDAFPLATGIRNADTVCLDATAWDMDCCSP